MRWPGFGVPAWHASTQRRQRAASQKCAACNHVCCCPEAFSRGAWRKHKAACRQLPAARGSGCCCGGKRRACYWVGLPCGSSCALVCGRRDLLLLGVLHCVVCDRLSPGAGRACVAPCGGQARPTDGCQSYDEALLRWPSYNY